MCRWFEDKECFEIWVKFIKWLIWRVKEVFGCVSVEVLFFVIVIYIVNLLSLKIKKNRI